MVWAPCPLDSLAAWSTQSGAGPVLSRQYPAFWNKWDIDLTYSAVMVPFAPGNRVIMLSPSS